MAKGRVGLGEVTMPITGCDDEAPAPPNTARKVDFKADREWDGVADKMGCWCAAPPAS
jgi:hypothetical protein